MTNKHRSSTIYVASVILATMLSGCASIQLGDPARSAEIKKFQPKTEVGQVYVCRNSTTFGLAIRPDIEIDNKPIATVARSTYAYAEVAPGSHTIVAKTLEHDSKMPFTIAAGEQRFFQTWISVGIFAGWGIIDEIKETDGRSCVTDGELVEVVRNDSPK